MVNDQYRFNRAELLEWATSRRINVSPELFAEPEASTAPLPSVAEALQAGGIYYRIGGGDREAVLRSMIDLLKVPEDVDREFLLKIFLAREALGSTGIGDAIAIPHVRNPIVLRVPKPAITLCFLEKPIDFGAIDGQPVRILFTLVSPTVRAHLHLLSRLAFVLRDGDFKGMLKKEGTREEIIDAVRRLEPAGATAATEPAGGQATP